MNAAPSCPRCGAPIEKILGAVVVFEPAIEFTTCVNCNASLVRTDGGLWALDPSRDAGSGGAG